MITVQKKTELKNYIQFLHKKNKKFIHKFTFIVFLRYITRYTWGRYKNVTNTLYIECQCRVFGRRFDCKKKKYNPISWL